MNFQLTEEQRMARDMVRAFVVKEVEPVAPQMDHDGLYPHRLVKRLGELGLMGIFIPTDLGGSGLDLISYVIAMEELSKAWASLGVIMSVHNSLACAPILNFGTAAQKRKYLVPLARGERLGCYALTEPGAGSDAGSIKTRAERDGTDYVLNGNKIFVTNGHYADVAIVYAVTAADRGKKGISAFILEKGWPGSSTGRLEDKLGLRSSDTAELVFCDCRVPVENLLGLENEGFGIALSTLDGGRIGIAAQAVGIAQACLDLSIAHAKERHQFHRPIAEFQAVQWMLADMATELDAARLLTYRAAWLREHGRTATKEISMAKLLASETANRVAYKALQIFGGYGYMKDCAVERLFRDARVTTLYEGTSEIQRLVIARYLTEDGGKRYACRNEKRR